MTDRREQMIELAGRIARLRQELEAATVQFDVLLGKGQPSPATEPGKKVTVAVGHRTVAGSLADRILQLLQSSPEKKFGIDAIMEVAGGSSAQTVRSVVWRLAKHKRINKAGRGKYRALAKEAARGT